MPSTTPVSSAAELWGTLWGAHARDWALAEEQQLPTYEEAIRRVGIASGQRVLEVACGSGVFLRAAAARGAEVSGLDASAALLEIARERVPRADLRVGDLQRLPYGDDAFDLVAGFNAFFFADDMVAALREAGRVARPGAPVVIQVWGDPERCDLEALKGAVLPLVPGAGPRLPPRFWEAGVLEAMAEEAGLAPAETFDATWAYEYADEDAMLREMLAAGSVVAAARAAGEDAVRAAIVGALAPYRTPSGRYRLSNEWHYLVARA
jgi:SAM-dependent methyltransferase